MVEEQVSARVFMGRTSHDELDGGHIATWVLLRDEFMQLEIDNVGGRRKVLPLRCISL